MYPLYIKKEDVRDIVLWQRRSGGIIFLCLAITIAAVQLYISPRLLELYADFNVVPPVITQFSLMISFILFMFYVLSAFSFLFSRPDYSRVEKVARKYKRGEMIKTRELMESKLEWLFFGALFGTMAYFIFTVILPISRITGQY